MFFLNFGKIYGFSAHGKFFSDIFFPDKNVVKGYGFLDIREFLMEIPVEVAGNPEKSSFSQLRCL